MRITTAPLLSALVLAATAAHAQPTPARKPSTATRSVSILSDSFAIPQLGRTRRIWLYLPPD